MFHSTHRLYALVVAILIVSFSPTVTAQQAPNGWIQDQSWLFLGPLGNGNGCNPNAGMDLNWIAPFEIAEIAPEDNDVIDIDFGLAQSTEWNGAPGQPTWLSADSMGLAGGNDVINYLTMFEGQGFPATEQMAFAATYITYLGEESIIVEFCTASDDSIKVWLNNSEVNTVGACRGTAGNCSETALAIIHPGVNSLKTAVWQGGGGWGFRLRMQFPDGEVINDAHNDFLFANLPTDDPVETAPSGARREVATSIPECIEPGDVTVRIVGDGSDGPNVTIIEQINGPVEVKGITGGGVLEEPEEIVKVPVGMFEDARDVGGGCTNGETIENDDGSYTITGAGVDIWTNGDEFQFAYLDATGDFVMTAHVADAEWAGGSRWGKGGIMARQDLSRSSRYSMVQTHGENLADSDRFAGRRTHRGNDNFEETIFAAGDPELGEGGVQQPWMRLERIGNIFTGYTSTDGIVWEALGSQDWGANAPATVLLGLALTSHSGCNPSSIVFTDVELDGGDDPKPEVGGNGGTITWNLTREQLNQGVEYVIAGDAQVSLFGHDTEEVLPGPNLVDVTPNDGDGFGIFPFAHDIGNPCGMGNTVYNSDEDAYAVTGGGVDIWTNGDQFHYVYDRVAGDFTFTAHVKERVWVPGSRWGKVGIMARQDCGPRSRYASVQTHGEDPQDGDRFAHRTDHGGSNNAESGTRPNGEHWEWQRLSRIGNTFVGFLSQDGSTWEEVGRSTWPDAPEEVLIGLANGSHGVCELATITFDEVELEIPNFQVTRTIPPCPVPGQDSTVVLIGEGEPNGPTIDILENIVGSVEVDNISHGGTYSPRPGLTQDNPVGLFEDSRDIGDPCTEGGTVENDDGSYTVTGSGIDIWQNGDEFHYAYSLASGDFDMVARVSDRAWVPGSRWGKVGIMARQNGDKSARFSMVQTHGEDPQDSDRFAGRRTQGGRDNFEQTITPEGEHRDWMRLERVGNVFNGYFSNDDGDTWELQGTHDWGPNAPRTVMLGLAVGSHGNCDTASITFDEIEILGGDGPHDPLAGGGGVITWNNVERSVLAGSGVSYEVKAGVGSGNSVLVNGLANSNPISGPGTVSLTDGSAVVENVGIFDIAHDVGGPCAVGSSDYDAGSDTYTITGGGDDIWTIGDQFQFAYSNVVGDFSMVAHVVDRVWAPGSRWGKAGIMARTGCENNARYAMVQTHGEDEQDSDRFAGRRTEGGDDNFEDQPFAAGGPGNPGTEVDWMRLDREGNMLIGYYSSDGIDWIEMGRLDLGDSAPEVLMVGLAITSHAGCAPSSIVFDEVELSTEVDPNPGPLFRRGDTDGNGALEITDPINNLSFQFLGTFTPPCLDAADYDDNGKVEITDPIANLSHQFLGTAPPAPPGKDTCGIDTTPDAVENEELGCETEHQNCL